MAKKSSAPIYIREIHLQNFKGFEDFKINFDDFNILVGINNSGKSTILQAIIMCFIFLSEIAKGKSKIKKGDTRILSDLSRINLPNYKDAWHNKKMRSVGHGFISVIFTITFSNNLEFKFNLRDRYGHPNVTIDNCTREIYKQEVNQILSSNPHLIHGFIGVLPNEEFKTSYGLNRSILTGRHSEVLRNALLYLKAQNKKKFTILNKLIEKHFHGILVKNTINPRFQENVTALFRHKAVDLDIALGGSGFLQILQMITFIMITNSKIVLLDESDAHLHPSLQHTLIQMLTELGKSEKIQFIISTHSKEIVTHADPQQIIQISNDDKEAKKLTTDPEVIGLLNELGTIDNIDLALLMKTKRCLFVEGNEDKIIRNLANTLSINIFQLDKQVIVIRRTGMNDRYYDDLTIFKKFIGSDLKAYSIVDRDVKTTERVSDIIRNSQAKGVKTHVWNKHEIENYLIVPSLLERVFNYKLVTAGKTKLTISELNEIIKQSTEELKSDLTDQLAEELVHWNRHQRLSLDVSAANKMARGIIESKWLNLDDRLSVVNGKELLSKINKKIQTKYGVSTNPIELSAKILNNEIDPEVSSVFKEIYIM